MERRVIYQIKSLDNMIFRCVFNLDSVKKDDLKKITPTQLHIISYLIKQGDNPVYQKDLEKILNLRRATVSGVLQTMEKNNLISRIVNKNDTRTKIIILNEEMKNHFKQKNKKFDALDKEIIKGISDDELENFLSVIEKMKDNIYNSFKIEPCK